MILFNYSKAKRFKQDVIGNDISLKADLNNKSLLQIQAMAWIAQHKNFYEDLYELAPLVCATRLDDTDNMLDKFVRDGGGREKCKPNFVICILESNRQVEALTLTH